MGFLAFTTFNLVHNLIGILYIIFNVFLYTVAVFLVNGKINEWMNDDKSTNNSRPKQSSLPSFCLVNARSLLLKLDELSASLATNVVDFVAITETWLNGDFEDHLLSICGYNIFWRDRVHSWGGGVCGYLAQNIPCRHLPDLENPILNAYGSGYALTGYQDHFQESLCAWFIIHQDSPQKITEASMNM